MHRAVLLSLGLLAACGGSPSGPSPSTPLALSGTVTATNGGYPLADARVSVAGQTVTTDAAGHFSTTTAPGTYALRIEGAGLLPRELSVRAGGNLVLDAIVEGNGFDLGFYRQFVRNGYEEPDNLRSLRRWTTAPSFDIQTTDDTGAPVDPDLRETVRAAIADVVPLLTGGQFHARFGGGVPVRFVTDRPGCGGAPVGPVGAYIEIEIGCASMGAQIAAHETGHVLGFWHTDRSADLMFFSGNISPTPSTREQLHAAIAYSRPPGNSDIDSD